ncbi:class A beta-lactamase [Cognatazoarcus halotolerans]|uniref:class A beta-lactamase n=1 Tax=Cognatazoarcus halotolerans TaxID=2686016 RepID=UPI00190F867B|nr:class A beta-lactamase [Cognatazoarcus halotolerans]MCB1899427.1 class A beta-lactamase [Rhodocyclaceae bacterium]
MNRRSFLKSFATPLLPGCFGIAIAGGAAPRTVPDDAALQARLAGLEAAARGRLGVCILDTESGREHGYRADERFMMLSSFKLLACALVLHRVDAGEDSLDRRIVYGREALLPWSPVTEQHADGGGMRLAQLCEATITTSDNAAANLILATYGGPARLTAYVRALGDDVTRFDRIEPALNLPGDDDALDTTSPRAMVRTMQTLLLGDALSIGSRLQLQRWLLGSTTGANRLKAGLPSDWKIGDKTGTNQRDANDIAIVWPPGRPPLLVAAYLAGSAADGAQKDRTLAAVGALVRDVFG